MSLFRMDHKTVELHLRHPFRIARGIKKSVRNVIIRLSADGIEGLGEAAPNTRYGENEDTVALFLEQLPAGFLNDIESPDVLAANLDEAGRHFLQATSVPSVQSAKAAVEMAWLDWWSKTMGQPLWRLWQPDSETGPVTSFTIGLDEPDVMQQKIREAEEYPILKIKLGTERDRELIQAVVEVTDKPIRVDANEGWTTVEQALEALDFLSGYNVELVEQPMPAAMRKEMIQLKKHSSIPLCADESFEGGEDLDLIAEAFDIINIKLAKTGSMVGAKRLIEEAGKRGVKVMIGCMIESSLANTAGAVLSLRADYADLDGHLLISNDPYRGLRLDKEKRVVLSDRPGIGVKEK